MKTDREGTGGGALKPGVGLDCMLRQVRITRGGEGEGEGRA